MLISDFAKQVQAKLGVTTTESNTDFFLRWAGCENSQSANNPLNIVGPDNIVPDYTSSDDGVNATAAELGSGQYPVLIEALTSGDPENFNLSSELSDYSNGTYNSVYTHLPTDGDIVEYSAPAAPVNTDNVTGEPLAPGFDAVTVVNVGDNSQAVRNVQGLLCANGHSVSIDGDYGDLTEAAVKEFQSHEELTADGVVNAATWSKLLGV